MPNACYWDDDFQIRVSDAGNYISREEQVISNISHNSSALDAAYDTYFRNEKLRKKEDQILYQRWRKAACCNLIEKRKVPELRHVRTRNHFAIIGNWFQ